MCSIKIIKRKNLIYIYLCLVFIFLNKNLFSDEKYIKEIEIIRNPVFDESGEKHKNIYRSLNKIHKLTLKSTIKRDLLFNIGDIYDTDIIENTERKLRARVYIQDADIKYKNLTDTLVKVIVNVTDRWSTVVGGSIKKNEDGKDTIKVILKEYNLFGYGKTIRFRRDLFSKDEKNFEFDYIDEQLFNSYYKGDFSYLKDSKNRNSKYVVGKDFISDFDRTAYFFNFETNKDLVNNNIIDNHFFEYHYSNGRIIKRIEPVFRINYYTDIYNNETIKKNNLLGGIKFSTIHYIKTKNVTKFGITEDIELGWKFFIGYKNINRFFGANRPGWGFENEIVINNKFNNDYIFQDYKLNYTFIKNFDEKIIDFKINHFHKFFEKLIFANALTFKRTDSFKKFDFYTLGADQGLRGYENDFIRGNKYLLFNSELKLLLKKDFLNFFNIESTLLYDLGRTYNHNESVKLEKFYHNIGINIKLFMYKLANSEEINFSVAVPFKEKHSPYFSLGSSLDF